jgi:hypothetical protein
MSADQQRAVQIAILVASAPPLSAAVRDRLSVILRPSAPREAVAGK